MPGPAVIHVVEDKIPKSIEIGPFTFRVSTDEAELLRWKAEDQADLAGRYDEATLSITIDGTHAVGFQRDTLLHEALHALFGMTALEHELGDKQTEHIIRALTPALLDMLRRNPALISFLVAA